ncbi:MAG: phosphoribosylglycinamide formyltransferase [Rhizobiaceae bacterium]|nr:MAG: phosphoribosylglycinamide formyltransferase [Rhizobiaceae bacterium]CAG0973661.1 phosphoribosylglycinamide formyltransferase 1 [Rhizobiaceae bacterium]
MNAKRKRVAILISGRGSNMSALIAASREADYPATIVGVISDRPDAAGLRAAEAAGIAAVVVERRSFADRQAHDAAIDATLAGFGAEIVALAGYMRLLGADFVQRWQGRMINIHPSLLPGFKGLDTHRRALDAGVRIHGCSVHFVTADMDGGPLIAQAAVPVLADDTEDSLAARVLKAEHKLYPQALAMVCEGRAAMEQGRTLIDARGMVERNAAQVLFAPDLAEESVNIEDLARFTP